KALVVELSGHEATVVEVHLIFLFGTPLAIVKYHGGDGNIVAHAGHDFRHAHAPSAVAGIRNGGAMRRSHFGAYDGGQGVAAVAPAHGGEEAAWLFNAQI